MRSEWVSTQEKIIPEKSQAVGPVTGVVLVSWPAEPFASEDEGYVTRFVDNSSAQGHICLSVYE